MLEMDSDEMDQVLAASIDRLFPLFVEGRPKRVASATMVAAGATALTSNP